MPEKTTRKAAKTAAQNTARPTTSETNRDAAVEREQSYSELLRRKVAEISASEGPTFEATPPAARWAADPAAPGPEVGGARPEIAVPEAIIQWHRPVLWIQEDTFIDPNDRSSPDLLEMLNERRPVLNRAIPAIGRIEVMNNAHYDWVGTGWIVECDLGYDIAITNAHVAREFAERSGSGFVFRRGTADFGGRQAGNIDFREEIQERRPREFKITEILWISDDEILDMALMRVALNAGEDRLSGPIGLSDRATAGRNVAVIGYPGDDSRSYDAEKFERLFGRVFGKKRLAPGRLMDPHEWGLRHDCSTLPGNSGSVVLDIETGKALGLHYSGSMFRTNYAVPATEILRVLRERPWQGGEKSLAPPPFPGEPSKAVSPIGGAGVDGVIKIVVPLEITVNLGAPAPSVQSP